MVDTTKKNSDDSAEEPAATAEETVASAEETVSAGEPPVSEATVDVGDAAEGEDAADAAEGEDDDADSPVLAELDWVGTVPAAPAAPGRRWALIGGVAVLVAALAISTGVLGWMTWQHHRIDTARDQVQRAAVAYALVLTSIDSNKIDDNFTQVLDGATGEFKDMYAESSEKLRKLLVDNKATAHGQVVESAVQSISPDEGVVLLFVDQAVSNTNVPDPRLDRSRMKMTMKYVDGRWRAAKVELP